MNKIIQLAPGGVAPVLSYNVPEPTSYSGRNFIDLALPDAAFRDDIPYEPNVPTQEETLARLRAIQGSVRAVLARDGMTAPSSTHSALVLPGGERVSPELARLEPEEVEAMRTAGKELVIYRGMSGALRHRWVSPTRPEPRRAAAQAKADHGDAMAVSATGIYSNIIRTPANGTTVRGPHTGAIVNITGTVVASQGSTIGRVEVKVGDTGSWVTVFSAPIPQAEWRHDATLTSSGAVTIYARATSSGGGQSTTSVTVHVELQPAPDVTAPTLTIGSPAAGATLPGTSSGATVVMTGRAIDGQSGVRSVEVSLDDTGSWVAATRDASTGDWQKELAVPLGAHVLRARCTDAAGNRSHAQAGVTVVVPDTAPPALAVTSPAPGTQFAGPLDGVDVQVKGSASDASGVAGVVVSVTGGSSPVPATPKAEGDWSEWSATVRVRTSGTCTITAHAADTRGNESQESVEVQAILLPDTSSRLNRIILVESYRLSSYLGNYGVGRTLKTFSLLPGEKTRISIKTFTKSETDAKDARSILDSVTDEIENTFEDSMGKEQSNKTSYDESSKYSVEGEAKASWGWGSASIKAGASGGTNRAREEFVKNVSNATQKHVSKASARRDVQINTSYEVKETTGEETAVEREIENVNVSRTLNFVFRQMNQEFITLLHLVDVRLGFFKVVDVEGQPEPRYVYREFTLPEIGTLLEDTLHPEWHDHVRDSVVHQLENIFDYQEERRSFVEWRQIPDEADEEDSRYLRVRKDLVSTYRDGATGTEIAVPGIVLAANKYVLRTEGILAEALLGQGEALDEYSHGLQDEAVEARRLVNSAARQQLKRNRLAMQIIAAKDEEAAQLFAQLFPAFPPAVEEEEPQSVPPGKR